jgi:hypothetical protein
MATRSVPAVKSLKATHYINSQHNAPGPKNRRGGARTALRLIPEITTERVSMRFDADRRSKGREGYMFEIKIKRMPAHRASRTNFTHSTIPASNDGVNLRWYLITPYIVAPSTHNPARYFEAVLRVPGATQAHGSKLNTHRLTPPLAASIRASIRRKSVQSSAQFRPIRRSDARGNQSRLTPCCSSPAGGRRSPPHEQS